MGRGGLVAYVEAEIERKIALGQLHPSGQFASEAELARRYKVCRGTIREALRRLAARGLVVQHPGRRTRAVALDESLTLENLGLALHDARSPEARWLLEGYFSLRRQVLVELLVDCCAKASARDLDSLGSLCFRLWDAAKWESGERFAQVEFELLRLAARVAERPGHVLLVQSLQRAFLGGAAQLLPFMGGEALRPWVICADDALRERDVRALQHELPALLKACDERLLEQFAPAPKKPASFETHRDMDAGGLGRDAPVAEQSGSPAVSLHGEEQGLDLLARVPVRDDALHSRPCVDEVEPALLAPALAPNTCLSVEEGGLELLAPVAEQDAAVPEHSCVRTCDLGLGDSHCLRGEGLPVGSADGLLHVTWERLGRWAVRLWRCVARSLGPSAS